MPKQKGRAANAWKNEVVAIDPANSTLCDLSDLLVVRFCIFSDPALENIGIPTNKEVVEMQTDTATAFADKLAAINKLANMPAVHPEATKHCLAPSAAQFALVCGFGKVDRYVFRADNTMSRDSVTGDCIYKIEDAVYWLIAETLSYRTPKQWRNIIANVKHDASEYKSSYEDILEKEGLNKSEASRRVIFNCFKMQAIASYPALATLKAAYVKDLFTNLSKDYFLVREARAITKSSPKFQNLSNLCSERDLDRPWIMVASIAFAEAITLTEATHVLAEMCVGIVYFNLDSELELKVLGKQDVKTTF
ncbi:hypothetical protein HBI07_144360 [Parastagonospora nodorum]|nr:hypothetical protein HBI07_144360 [Parastagonospora nodorum]